MTRSTVVAYDVGTSGVKAIAIDEQGRVLASHVEGYGLDTPRPGWVEQDLEAIMASLGRASRRVMDAPGVDPREVVAAAVTGQMFSTVPVDGSGQPLRPMLSWLDQRSHEEADAIVERSGPDRGYGVFGAVVSGKDIVPKIAWLRTHDDDPRTAWYLDCKEAVVARLTGVAAIDPCGASAYRLTDRTNGTWADDACRVAGIPTERLPPILAATQIAGRVTRQAAEPTGLRAGTPVIVGAGDVPAGQIGAGAHGDGDAHLSLGTAAYLGITMQQHRDDPAGQLGPLRHVVPGEWILWLETATGGGALAWLRRALGRIDGGALDHETLDGLVASAADDMDGLLFAPWLTGERVPLFDDTVRAAFVNLSLHHGPGHLARAVMEGVAAQITTAFEYGLAYGVSPGSIRAVGGGGIGAVWTQVIADTLGRPLDIVAEPQDAAARGVAGCALVAVGAAADVGSAVPAHVTRTVRPDPVRSGTARERLERFRGLHHGLRALGSPQA